MTISRGQDVSYSTDTAVLKVPPHSIEAEQSVLGGLMISNDAFDDVSAIINATDFYRRAHQLIFTTIAILANDNKPSDTVTISEILDVQGTLDEAGGFDYLGSLAANTPSAANIKTYADIVKERAISRALIDVGSQVQGLAWAPDNATQKLDKAQSLIMSIHDDSSQSGPVFIRDGLVQFVDGLEMRFQSKAEVTGLATGFLDPDRRTTGFQPGDFIIIAGRPAMGKTTFALNIAEYQSIKLKVPTLTFSMEMPEQQLTQRIISSCSGVDLQKIRTGRLEDADWPRITNALKEVQESALLVDDTPGLTVNQIRSRARKAKKEHDIKLIMVDYLQLMTGEGDTKNEKIGDISMGLKNLARELGIPVIALSQLNRGPENRPNKRPVPSDLRESGSLEQDADIIMFIYRDEVYNPDSPDCGIAEIITAKQRNGEIGTDRLNFVGRNSKFTNYEVRYG